MDGASTPSSPDEAADPPPSTPPAAKEKDKDPDEPQLQTPSPSFSPESSVAAMNMKKERARVRFNSNAGARRPPESLSQPPSSPGPAPPRVVIDPVAGGHGASSPKLAVPRPAVPPRPSVLRGNSANSITTMREISHDVMPEREEAASAAAAAQERAKQVAAKVRRGSATPESRHSTDSDETATSEFDLISGDGHGRAIPMQNLAASSQPQQPPVAEEAYNLVQAHARRFGPKAAASPLSQESLPSSPDGHAKVSEVSEINDGQYDGVYNVPAPEHYRGSVLSQLLKLYKPTDVGANSMASASSTTLGHHSRNSVASMVSLLGDQSQTLTPGSESGTTTPNRKKWYNQNKSQDTLANLVEASARLANPNTKPTDPKSPSKKRPTAKRRTSSQTRANAYWQREQVRITAHIAETLCRQEYIIKLCRALMLFGAPTHRLEEYLQMTARFLEIDGQFLYLPGCMVISFDDKSTHTAELRIVRSAQGIDLGRLKDVHLVYKEIMHDVIDVEEGTERLDTLMNAKDKFHPWFRVIIFGLTSAAAAPFSFKARMIDLPLIFFFGCLVGMLQLIVAPRSDLYMNVFEVSATILISFLARAFGSIKGGTIFCFSALAQGGIVMLLPGYLVLCSALEIQSHAIVPGSIRIVYAIIYCLLLGFGITVGAVIYGLVDENASSATTCEGPIDVNLQFIFVPFFIVFISMIYQAKWRQLPVMIFIAFSGYVVNFFSAMKFVNSPQISNTLGAFTVGVLANLYSRLRHGVAAATLIPAIFCQVPGGLASTGGLLSGIKVANQIANASRNGTDAATPGSGDSNNNVVFDVAASMVQIAIGIAVGLFMSALVIYPLGKRRSGLFSF